MKIIDFERKGNVVRFYLGADDLKDWTGDDWNDSPYTCNAGKVYPKYISGYKDVIFGFDYNVAEPSSRACNHYWSKDDMKNRKVPCIVAILSNDDYCDDFECISQDDKAVRYYFGDKMEPEND